MHDTLATPGPFLMDLMKRIHEGIFGVFYCVTENLNDVLMIKIFTFFLLLMVSRGVLCTPRQISRYMLLRCIGDQDRP